MATHRLTAFQFIPRPIDEVFGFFAEPRNLTRLTPAGMGFRFLTKDFAMREGLEIEYRLTPLLSVPIHWKTVIDRYQSPFSFRDVQVEGPYRRWVHSHEFREADGGTWVEDEVEYELPLSAVGELGHWLIKGELRSIFRYRAQAMRNIFAEPRRIKGLSPSPLPAEPDLSAAASRSSYLSAAITSLCCRVAARRAAVRCRTALNAPGGRDVGDRQDSVKL